VLGWAAAYVVIAVVAAVVVLARREPTIVRGDWVFLLTAVFVLLAAIVTALRGGRFSLGELSITVAVLIAGFLLQSRWWVIGANAATVGVTVDECASRLCAPTTRTGHEAIVTVPGGAIRLRIAPAGASTVIVFVASAKHRKVALFRRLLAKQYRPVMPTLRIGDAPAGSA
jgi:hypothetical protein